MRIGLLAPLIAPLREPQIGGAQALVCDLAAALAARGHEVEVVAATGSHVPGVEVVDSGVDAAELEDATYVFNQALTRLPAGGLPPAASPLSDGRSRSDGGSRAGAATEAAYRRALAVTRGRGYDVLHNHAFDAAAIRHAGGAAAAVIHTLHLPPDPRIVAAIAEARHSRRAPAVACVSAAQAQAWRRLIEVDEVLANGVPVEAIGWDGRPGDCAVFAGRLSPEKGVDDAVRIALRSGLAIEVYGAAYDPDFARRCRARWRGNPAVRFCGAVSRGRLWRRLARALALIVPPRWDEPFGLAAAEAQAAGTPVIGYRSGGLVEVVAEGRSGFLVDSGDVESAAAALRRVGGAIARSDCREHAERHLDIATTAAAHERLYAEWRRG